MRVEPFRAVRAKLCEAPISLAGPSRLRAFVPRSASSCSTKASARTRFNRFVTLTALLCD